MKVWIAEGDDRNYDEGSMWVVGVYSSEEKAKKGAEEDLARYCEGRWTGAKEEVFYTTYEMEVQ